MTEFSQHVPGTFSWVDLATSNAEAAKKFYSGLFGWSAVDMPAGEAGIYSMLQLGGKAVAGLSEMGQEQRAQGVPPHWMSYVTVASADGSAAKAKSLGGTVVAEPFDVMDAGRMALIQDPTGAMLAMWEPRAHIGAQLVNEPGTLSWNELATNDAAKAGPFYSNLFDWDTQVQEMPTTTYTTFINQGRMNAGMLQMTEEWGNIPPHWMVYFAVADCNASAERAAALGGTLLVPPTDLPSIGRFAVVQDPQGAVFSIISLDNPD